MKKLFFLIILCCNSFAFSQSGSSRTSRFMDDSGWTPWKILVTYTTDGLLYLIPGLLLLFGSWFLMNKRDYDNLNLHPIIEIILIITALGGLILTGIGAFHLIFLISNLEIILWTAIYIGIAAIFLFITLEWLYKKIKNRNKIGK